MVGPLPKTVSLNDRLTRANNKIARLRRRGKRRKARINAAMGHILAGAGVDGERDKWITYDCALRSMLTKKQYATAIKKWQGTWDAEEEGWVYGPWGGKYAESVSNIYVNK